MTGFSAAKSLPYAREAIAAALRVIGGKAPPDSCPVQVPGLVPAVVPFLVPDAAGRRRSSATPQPIQLPDAAGRRSSSATLYGFFVSPGVPDISPSSISRVYPAAAPAARPG